MDKQWYVTNRVPGGELACRADSYDEAWELFSKIPGIANHPKPPGGIGYESYSYNVISYRNAPPDLAEWLDAEMHVEQRLDKNAYGPDSRTKVPGGWFYAGGAGESAAAVFVPVAGSANITIIAGDQ